jgi:hypothetical protein
MRRMRRLLSYFLHEELENRVENRKGIARVRRTVAFISRQLPQVPPPWHRWPGVLFESFASNHYQRS